MEEEAGPSSQGPAQTPSGKKRKGPTKVSIKAKKAKQSQKSP